MQCLRAVFVLLSLLTGDDGVVSGMARTYTPSQGLPVGHMLQRGLNSKLSGRQIKPYNDALWFLWGTCSSGCGVWHSSYCFQGLK